MVGAQVTNKVITEFQIKASGKAALDKIKVSTDRARIAANALKMQHREISNVMKATGLSANQSARAMKQLGFTFNKAGFAVDALGRKMKLTKKIMTDMRKTTRRFNMGFLSLMFASMALNRAVGTFLRSAIGAYAKATGESNAFRKETNKLVASWEFFKFSLIDALTKSEVFAIMVQRVTDLVMWFNKLTPATKAWIAIGIGIIFIVSLIGMVIGQIGLAAGGIQVLGDMFRWFGTVGFISALSVVAILIGLGIIIFAIVKIVQTWGDDWFDTMEFIGIATIGLGILVIGVAAKMALAYAAIGTAASAAAATTIIAWGLATGGIIILIGAIIISVTKIVKNWDEAKLAASHFFAKIRQGIVNFISGMKIMGEQIKHFFLSITAFGEDQTAENRRHRNRLANIKKEKNMALALIKAEQDERIMALARQRHAEALAAEISGTAAGALPPELIAAQAGLPSIEDFQSLQQNAPNITTTNIGDVKIDISGGLADAGDIADQVMEKLNNITNQSLDSSNI